MNAAAPLNAPTSLIQLDDLKKVFYTDEVETHALSGVHFEIMKGDYLSIAGPSGCGKSTLLSILGLLDTPSGGRYLLYGTPVVESCARNGTHSAPVRKSATTAARFIAAQPSAFFSSQFRPDHPDRSCS